MVASRGAVTDAQRVEAFLIAGIALAQAFTEDALQAGEAVEAEMLGEADQRGRLDAGRDRDAGRGAESDLVRVVESIGRDLGDTLGQALALGEDRCAQLVEIARQLRNGGFAHSRIPVAVPLADSSGSEAEMEQAFHGRNERSMLG